MLLFSMLAEATLTKQEGGEGGRCWTRVLRDQRERSPDSRYPRLLGVEGLDSRVPRETGRDSWLRLCLLQSWGILNSRIGAIPRPPRFPSWWGIPRLYSLGRWKIVPLVFPGTPGESPTKPNTRFQLCPQSQFIPEWPARRRASHSSPARASGGSMFPAVVAVTEPG